MTESFFLSRSNYDRVLVLEGNGPSGSQLLVKLAQSSKVSWDLAGCTYNSPDPDLVDQVTRLLAANRE